MQANMQKAQEELANEIVEALGRRRMVTVQATGAGEIVVVKIAPEAIDPGRPGDARGPRRRGREQGAPPRRSSRSRSSAASRVA